MVCLCRLLGTLFLLIKMINDVDYDKKSYLTISKKLKKNTCDKKSDSKQRCNDNTQHQIFHFSIFLAREAKSKNHKELLNKKSSEFFYKC